MEAKLFGHEKDIFTGVLSSKASWFEEANGCTLFLDEIGALLMPIQVKLLRMLPHGEVVRLGYSDITLHAEAQQKLIDYFWPGNIGELENVIHHTLLICRANLIRAEKHLSKLRLERQDESSRPQDESAEALLQRVFHKLFEEESGALHEKVQESLLTTAYRFCHYNQVHTAQLLGLSRNIIRAQLIKAGELVVNKRRPTPGAQGEQAAQFLV